MLGLRLLLVIAVFLGSTLLFRIAAGSLKITKLNMISAIYYYLLVFSLIGGSLTYLGMREHYMLRFVQDPENIDRAYYALAYAMILLPLTMILVKKFLGVFLRRREIREYTRSEICVSEKRTRMFFFVLFLGLVCAGATLYVFRNLGYNPVTALLKRQNLSALRQAGGSGGGNQYIKNLLMTALTPYVSYLAYIYARVTREKKWCFLFLALGALSVLVLTYDFQKAPVIMYLIGFYLLEVGMGNILNLKWFRYLAIIAVALIIGFYVLSGAGSHLGSIYTGPAGRIIFSQFSPLILHLDVFPARTDFLNGASFNSWISALFPAAEGLRSGRIVMEMTNPAGIREGVAGVMNTVFIGEAWANFGTVGIVIAPIIFGVIIGLAATLIPAIKKSPVTILLYAQLTLLFMNIVEGGFVDIFYSASTIFLLGVTVAMWAFSGSGEMAVPTRLEKGPGGRFRWFRFGKKDQGDGSSGPSAGVAQ